MKFDTKDLLVALPHLAKNPSLTVSILALLVPVVLLFSATQFSGASIEALVFFGVLGVSTLAYSAWVVSLVKGGSDGTSK